MHRNDAQGGGMGISVRLRETSQHPLPALLAQQQDEIRKQQQELQNAWERVELLVGRYSVEDPEERRYGVERLHGASAVHNHLTGLMRSTDREALALTPGSPSREMGATTAESLAKNMLERSIRVRAIYSDRIREDAECMVNPQGLARSGAEVRTIPRLSFRVYIADRRTALMQLHGNEAPGEAMATEEPAMVAVLCSFFDALWASATPLGGTELEHSSITTQEHELLRLLGQGLTDEAAARKLGVSLRTERRMLTKLSDALDARSRFQLGQRAVEHGIL
ncbi:helix-turn-helix transcriptional regulator [Streptomyces mirabilis]|uniref:helix-turn-helix domain-containing protein n=1 Tax=Streptomyces mirabilis TaxID=68239 RepID=UPI0021C0ADB4|nr:helix-turn-helix transcriptional regulator [Streptomyces mirabilis]MCT9108124.1 helix-turn-helix transcriptional regulator [Streptomyces mirabilis]